MKALLRDRNARWYLSGQMLPIFGDTSLFLATGIWVKELTHSNGDAGLTFFFFVLATMVSPLAGVVVDRFRRRPVLIVSNLAGAAVGSSRWSTRRLSSPRSSRCCSSV